MMSMKATSTTMALCALLLSLNETDASIFVCNYDPCTVKYVPVCMVETDSAGGSARWGTMTVQTHVVYYGQCLTIPDEMFGWVSRTYAIHGVITSVSTGWISLTRYTGQTYPGTSIWPNVCTNAQPEYCVAKFVIDGFGSPGWPVSLYVDSGPVTVSPSTAYRGDVVTVTPTGTGTGPYTIRARRLDGCQSTYSGTVFGFGFSAERSTDFGPSGTLNAGSSNALYDGPSLSAEVNGLMLWVAGGRAAYVSNNYRAKVVTYPANAFSGSVNATLSVSKQCPVRLYLVKNLSDNGPSTLGSVRFGFLSLTIPDVDGGDNRAAAASAGCEVTINGEAGPPSVETRSTHDFDCPWDRPYQERDFVGQLPIRSNDTRTGYIVGSTEREVRIRVQVLGHTTTTQSPLGLPWGPNLATGVVLANAGGPPVAPEFTEEDNTFDIQ